jgi:hypothetical protein
VCPEIESKSESCFFMIALLWTRALLALPYPAGEDIVFRFIIECTVVA